MTDRELLELAAKAAGIEGVWNCGFEGKFVGFFTFLPNGSLGGEWNPLADGDDALRLACDCYINIEFRSGYVIADGPQGAAAEEFKGGDRCAATRLAIVRAAAEISKARES